MDENLTPIVDEQKAEPTQDKVVEKNAKTAENKVVEVKAKDLSKESQKEKKKKEKVKNPSKVAKALKSTGNELKKVNWPKFKEVAKQTGIVLAVTVIFMLVLFGFDRLCSWLSNTVLM